MNVYVHTFVYLTKNGVEFQNNATWDVWSQFWLYAELDDCCCGRVPVLCVLAKIFVNIFMHVLHQFEWYVEWSGWGHVRILLIVGTTRALCVQINFVFQF